MSIKKNINEFTFIDHLEELRWRIIKVIIAFVIILIISLFFVPSIFYLIKMPISKIQTDLNVFTFQGYFFAYIKIGFISSIIFTFPIALYQLSKFIIPGLYKNEKKWFYLTISLSAMFFLLGVSFSYIILTPISFNFLYNFASNSNGFNIFTSDTININLLPGLNEYIDLFIMIIFFTGIAFQLPLVIMFLTLIEVINDKILTKYRPHTFVIILVIAAILTPPDVITQLILGIPMYLLFELSILISRIIRKRKEKKENEIYKNA